MEQQAFIQWNGANENCPVDHEERVDVVLRSGYVGTNVRAGSLLWRHELTGADVLQFRRHENRKPGAEYLRAINDVKNIIRESKDTDPLTLIKNVDRLKNVA